MNSKLVFDIGCNNGEDARFYAHQGYEVIAIDADPYLIEANKSAAKTKAITYLNLAVGSNDNEELELYINEDNAHNSLIATVGGRNQKLKDVVKVKTMTLRTLFEQYGVPYYCKIDIEGFDAIAIRSMQGAKELPKYMSAEAECQPLEDRFSEDGVLDTLEALKETGYTKFKLVDQTTLYVLSGKDYYIARTTLPYKIIRKIQKVTKNYSPFYTNKQRLIEKHGYPLSSDSTGPFGEDLAGDWIDYETAKKMYLFHRRAFFSKTVNHAFTFWVDWHATR